MEKIKVGGIVDLVSAGDKVYSPIFGYGVVQSLIILNELKISVKANGKMYFF